MTKCWFFFCCKNETFFQLLWWYILTVVTFSLKYMASIKWWYKCQYRCRTCYILTHVLYTKEIICCFPRINSFASESSLCWVDYVFEKLLWQMSENSLPFAHRTEREPSFKALGGALKRESRRRLLEIQATEKQGLPTLVENCRKNPPLFKKIKITVKF